jgi:thioredoxin reductase (NADPH)
VAAVFVAIGRVPNTKFVKGLVDLNSEGYIVAEEDCKTSLSGVFVAGDCRTKQVRQLVTAAGDAAVAAAACLDYLVKK